MSITELPPPTTTPLYERIAATKKAEVVQELSDLLGARYVLHTAYDLMLYEYDASIDRSVPGYRRFARHDGGCCRYRQDRGSP